MIPGWTLEDVLDLPVHYYNLLIEVLKENTSKQERE